MLMPANSTTQKARAASLEIHLLGLLDFDSAVVLQEQLVDEVTHRSDGQGALLLCEHPPLVSVGREGSRAHIRCDDEELRSRQLEIRWLNRRGGCVMHAPGQLAIYPIIPLTRRGLAVRDYRRAIEAALIDVCDEMQVHAFGRDDVSGVWCRTGQLAHVGISVRSWVSCHGCFLNVAPDMQWQRLVDAGGRGERVTSLLAERTRPVKMHAVRESVVRRLVARLHYARFHVYTGHHSLHRTSRMVLVEGNE